MKSDSQNETDKITQYLDARLETILVNWRIRCESDEIMNSKSVFTREEFNDQVPVLMAILLQRLRGQEVSLDPVTVAGEHGLHRWQAGYALPELTVEIEHLFATILEEIDKFYNSAAGSDASAFLIVQQQVFKLYSEVIRGSIFYYHQLLQNNAAERVQSLEFALDQLQQLGKQRGEHLRESSHDLRASFSVLMVASQMLEMPRDDNERTELMEMLNRNLFSLREMLLQLTDYAKVEAAQDELDIQEFDVAGLIKDTLSSAQPMARRNALMLEGNGPDEFIITSDRIKVQRILINLIQNALKYTRSGSIYVTWAQENPLRWTLSVQDTGAGFTPGSPSALLAAQLKPPIHTTTSHQQAKLMQEPPAPQPTAKTYFKESEGLGLFIVKKLCEQMKASMDIESERGKGTLVRIRFLTKQEPNKM
ncbi:HAMP domain-containing sensor histidine kinase [Dyadobacter sp. CY326]|uniref:sensor histidine kinase n=1 Tax=Dyadobacter sp. CY326 TaxID=2907300 RepID=UPI001F263B31|nr:HAMP domain-containing sensor histidine kinase [Dyadobacter sp. CY326]MCE7064089.1 HAMP domain-containing histidine kinase [Dyadobacter sp. CY326]